MPKDYEDSETTEKQQAVYTGGSWANFTKVSGHFIRALDNDEETFFEGYTTVDGSVSKGTLYYHFYGFTGRAKINIRMDVKSEVTGKKGYFQVVGKDQDLNTLFTKDLTPNAFGLYIPNLLQFEADVFPEYLYIYFWSEISGQKTYVKVRSVDVVAVPDYSLPAGTNSIGQVEQNPDILADSNTTVRTKSHNILVAQKALNSSYTAEAIGASTAVPTANFTILANATVIHPGGVRAEIVSTSANDTAAGTGIRKLKLTYFNSSYEKLTEIITMNGLVNVNTTETDIWRIHSLEAIEIGNGVFAVGTITIKSIGGANLFAQIDIGNNFFTRCLRYVQPGKRGFVQDILVSSTTKEGVDFRLFGDVNNDAIGGGKVSLGRYAAECVDDVLPIHFDMPIVIDASASTYPLGFGIAVQGKAAAQNATASIKYWEE